VTFVTRTAARRSLARHVVQDALLERAAGETAEMPRAALATTPDEAALLTMLARLNDRVTADDLVDSVMVLVADELTFVGRR
jgi:hypothetical protein